MNSAVITGATGMIGIALVQKLLAHGYEIAVLVNPDSPRISNIPPNPHIRLIRCGLAELKNADSLFDRKYDVFYHLGWAGTMGTARDNMPLQTLNIQYTLDAVDLAYRLGCRVFLGAGSQAEYGRVDGVKLSDQVPTFPDNGYGMAKLCAGQMSRVKCTEYGIKHIWVRILSVFGPYDSRNTMVMSSIHSFLHNTRPQYTKGEQKWDYLYCKDAAQALLRAAEQGSDGAIYCIGSGQAQPLREYIKKIRDAINPKAEISLGEVPYSEKQVMYLCADISNLQRDTGFHPEYSFEEGIRETIRWYMESAEEGRSSQ